jgi:hypothetical protein
MKERAAAPKGVRALADRYAGYPVLEERTEREGPRGPVRRVRLIRTRDAAQPLLRVVDEMTGEPGKEELVRQTAMAADRVLVKLRGGVSEEAMLAALRMPGAAIIRRLGATGVRLVSLPEGKIDTVPEAISRLEKVKELVEYAEPDYVAHTTGGAGPNQ